MKNEMMETPTVRCECVAKVQQPPTRAVNTPPIKQLDKRIAPVRSSLISSIAPWFSNMSHVRLADFTKLFPCKPTWIQCVPTLKISSWLGTHESSTTDQMNSFFLQYLRWTVNQHLGEWKEDYVHLQKPICWSVSWKSWALQGSSLHTRTWTRSRLVH